MARTKIPEPTFRTPEEEHNKVEQFKRDSRGVVGALPEHVRDLANGNIAEDSEQLAKSHGIYLEYNRAQTGREKDWLYMVRVTVPGGGSFTAEQWRVFDQIAEERIPFIGYHMPFPAIGYAEKLDGGGYRFIPETYQLDVDADA